MRTQRIAHRCVLTIYLPLVQFKVLTIENTCLYTVGTNYSLFEIMKKMKICSLTGKNTYENVPCGFWQSHIYCMTCILYLPRPINVTTVFRIPSKIINLWNTIVKKFTYTGTSVNKTTHLTSFYFKFVILNKHHIHKSIQQLHKHRGSNHLLHQ